MRCPYCGADDSKVIDTTHDARGGVRRRRHCQNCEQRFNTYERALLATPLLSSTTLRALAMQAGGGPIRWSLSGVSDLVSLDPAQASDLPGFTVVGLFFSSTISVGWMNSSVS